MRIKKSFLLLTLLVFTLLISFKIYSADNKISFNDDELKFIKDHSEINLGVDPFFVPFEFFDEDGEYKGIADDYIKIISKKTGIKFNIIKGLTWQEAYDLAKNGEIDALPAVSKTKEREEYFNFSKPYYYFKRVIVTKDDNETIKNIDDLKGLTVAVEKNSSHHSYLLSFKDINLSLYNSVEEALTAVANGSEKVFVGNLATTNYIIKENALTNLKFIAFEPEKKQGIHFAVRKDWPELVTIIDKVLDSLTEEEKLAINNKWIGTETDYDYSKFINIIIMISGVIVLVIIVSSYWITKLRKEIKKRKQIQIDLEEAKKIAEEANDFKSGFMARMSHEIRTPLNAIMGMAYLLKKSDITLTQSMYTDRITQAANNMLSIINDILDFSKIESGKVVIEETSFDIDQVIQEVINIISYKIEEQEIGFKLVKDPNLPNWFLGDPKRIEQILLNILNNAVKFTSEGEVSLDIRMIAKKEDNYHISFTVKDTGIGMDDSQVENLFKPYVQADSSINRRFGGSGLGLSIVKNLIELMGGDIEVYSTINDGTTFVFNLTLKLDKEKQSEYLKTISSEHFMDLRTLVLEKSGANMNMIESYLSSFGMHCELTTSENSALTMLELADNKFAKNFDLLIIDYDTPQDGGFNYIEKLRKNNNIKMPKVIMLLPMLREDLFDKLKYYKIDFGIGKPIIPSVLFNGILDIFNLRAVNASKIKEDLHDEIILDKKYTVLIAEDNKTNQLIAKSLLEKKGINIIIANDGAEAVDKFKENEDEIDIILMDLHMPIMNGYDSAKEIKSISSREIPIIALTADVILGVKEKCENAGMNYYISKPFDPEKFIKTITEMLCKNPLKKDSVINVLKGVSNLGGDEFLYMEVLKEYYKEFKNTVDEIKNSTENKDFERMGQIVHKIKSSSGSIGAEALYEEAVIFYKYIKELDYNSIDIHKEIFIQELIKVLDEIDCKIRGEV